MTIYQDARESEDIANAIRKYGIEVERRQLDVGDYSWGEIIVERKTFQDFMSSVNDGRLWTQAYNMMGAKGRIIVVTGDVPRIRYMGKQRIVQNVRDVQVVKKRFFELSTRLNSSFGIWLMWLRSHDDFPLWLVSAYHTFGRKGSGDIFIERKEKTVEGIRLDMVTRLPGIGSKHGKELLEKFKSINGLCDATPEQLDEVKGIGSETAKKIVDVLH